MLTEINLTASSLDHRYAAGLANLYSKVFPATYHYAVKAYSRRTGKFPLILNISTRYMRVA